MNSLARVKSLLTRRPQTLPRLAFPMRHFSSATEVTPSKLPVKPYFNLSHMIKEIRTKYE
jgi:hypothetical protein